jgi:hypothetical protein
VPRKICGIHNYSDVNRFRDTGTRAIIRALGCRQICGPDLDRPRRDVLGHRPACPIEDEATGGGDCDLDRPRRRPPVGVELPVEDLKLEQAARQRAEKEHGDDAEGDEARP